MCKSHVVEIVVVVITVHFIGWKRNNYEQYRVFVRFRRLFGFCWAEIEYSLENNALIPTHQNFIRTKRRKIIKETK